MQLTATERLYTDADYFQAWMSGNLQLYILIGGWHPHGQSSSLDQGASGKVQDIPQHRFKAIWLAGSHVTGETVIIRALAQVFV
jgi:hypothetical protein